MTGLVVCESGGQEMGRNMGAIPNRFEEEKKGAKMKVSVKKLTHDIERILSISQQAEENLDDLRTGFRRLEESWEGDASEAYSRKVDEELAELRFSCTRMKVFLMGMNQAAALYSACGKAMERNVQT